MKNQGKRDKTITREVKQEMSITKARQMILHLNEKSGEKPIFHHVDCSKLPQNPESAPQSTSVAGGNLLAAMFGTADDEEDELQGDSRYESYLGFIIAPPEKNIFLCSWQIFLKIRMWTK